MQMMLLAAALLLLSLSTPAHAGHNKNKLICKPHPYLVGQLECEESRSGFQEYPALHLRGGSLKRMREIQQLGLENEILKLEIERMIRELVEA